MQTATYSFTLESTMGPKFGTLRLERHDASLCGVFTILGTANRFCGGSCSAHTCLFPCTLQTEMGPVECQIFLMEDRGVLHGTAKTNRGSMEITGLLCPDAPAD